MPRVPFPKVDPTDAAIVQDARYGFLPNLYRVMLHTTPVTKGWLGLGSAIRYETQLPPDIRELSICCVAAKTGSEYEWHHHYPLALDAGITMAELKSLHDGDHEKYMQGSRLVCTHYTIAVVAGVVDQELVDQTVSLLGLTQFVELTALASYYTAVARFIAALDIEIEGYEDEQPLSPGG